MSDAVRLEEELFGGCFESADQQEGMANFLRKKDDPAKVKHVAFQNK
jgi:enoyl-CoA hydratase